MENRMCDGRMAWAGFPAARIKWAVEDGSLTPELHLLQECCINSRSDRMGLVTELNLCGSLHTRHCDLILFIMCEHNKTQFITMDTQLVL